VECDRPRDCGHKHEVKSDEFTSSLVHNERAMRIGCSFSLISLAFCLASCGSDDSSDKNKKDADILGEADTAELKKDALTTSDVVSQDVFVKLDQATKLDQAVADVAVVDVASSPDVSSDGTTPDTTNKRDILSIEVADQTDAAEPDAPVDAAISDATPKNDTAINPYYCRTNADCCIKIDSCTATGLLYSKAPGAAAEPTFGSSGNCLACIPPQIDLQCVNHVCQGTHSSRASLSSHCGSVDSVDAGAMIITPSDHLPIAYSTIWHCGD
jgi:hypothetical protein